MNEKNPYTVGSQPYQPVPSRHQAAPAPHYQWQPSFFRRAPWLAIVSLFLAFLCAATSAIVIAVSDNEVADWRIQPAVILAFLSAVASALLLVTLRYGVAITWWRAVTDVQGTTLAKLHHIWDHGGGGGLRSALFAGRNMNKITIASIIIAITGIAYSPLLQRASHTRPVIRSSNTTLLIEMAKNFPPEAGGTIGSDGEPSINTNFLSAIQDWHSNNNMATNDEEGYTCNGTCNGYVAATGIMGDECAQTREQVDVLDAAKNHSYVFSVNFTHYEDVNGLATLEMTVKGLTEANDSCAGVLVTNTCKMHAGLVNFPLLIEQDNITFNSDISREFLSDPVNYAGDMPGAKLGDSIGPLGSLYWFGQTYFEANATLTFNETSGNYTTNLIGPFAAQYYDSNPDGSENLTQACQIQFTDPTADVIRAFSDVLFRGAYYSSGDDTLRSFPAVHTQPTLIYESVYSYLAIATALVFLAILAASSTLWGWWELGRKVSLSPLETGKAFGAHVLDDTNGPEDAGGLLRSFGGRKVRYGEMHSFRSNEVTAAILGVRQVGIEPGVISPRRNTRR